MNPELKKLSNKEIKRLIKDIGISYDDIGKIIGAYKTTIIFHIFGRTEPTYTLTYKIKNYIYNTTDNYQILYKTIKRYPKVLYYLIFANREQFHDRQFRRILSKIERYAGPMEEVDDLF